jgi:protein involved in polysaccharide export with SLBB domain
LGLDNTDKLLRLQEAFIVETEVDPERYILGPGDKIGVSIITSLNAAYILTITPTGELWIPDIGSIHIAGKTILDAENQVVKYVHKHQSKTADICLVLLNIRNFRIQIKGAVVFPGFVNVSSIERLTDGIKKAGGLHKLSDEENILISRIYGEEFHCSLKLYHYDGELINNPTLKGGDVVHVPFISEFTDDLKKSISHKASYVFVTGFVLRPKGHSYISGYTIDDYIAMSGGVTDFGNKSNITIHRNGELLYVNEYIIIKPGDQIDISANMKYRMLGNMSFLQTLTAMMTLYLTYQAAIN